MVGGGGEAMVNKCYLFDTYVNTKTSPESPKMPQGRAQTDDKTPQRLPRIWPGGMREAIKSADHRLR